MKLLGHRGARFEKPENTMSGFLYALEFGMDGIECDVRKTQDQQIVIIHDETVDRTSNGSGKVSDLSLDELLQLDFGEGEKIQLLENVIPVICEKAILFIELKDDSVEEVVEIVSNSEFKDKIVIKSFDHRQLKKISELDPTIELAALMVCTPSDPELIANSCGASTLSINLSYIDKELVDRAHQSDILICGWNCNDLEQMKNYKALKLDWVGTDTPSLFQ
ncbi:MAG: hypothetical protein EP319_02330 [Deltaproteobacteria bacterium]|nr:MAG: hypothetical protein EP319_02330 [Deltaproteobacteria bacterium]